MALISFWLLGAHSFGEVGETGKARVALDGFGDFLEVLERLGLLEILADARDVGLELRVFKGLDDKRAKKMADQLVAEKALSRNSPRSEKNPRYSFISKWLNLPPSLLYSVWQPSMAFATFR
jgi:hypothetical protein